MIEIKLKLRLRLTPNSNTKNNDLKNADFSMIINGEITNKSLNVKPNGRKQEFVFEL